MKDQTHYKEILEEERDKLVVELNKLGRVNPNNPGDWDVKGPDMDVSRADENEAADRNEELHIDSIVLDELALRHRNIVRALEKVEEGTFGTCEVCTGTIEEDRLDANPAARTCKAHLGEESTLES